MGKSDNTSIVNNCIFTFATLLFLTGASILYFSMNFEYIAWAIHINFPPPGKQKA